MKFEICSFRGSQFVLNLSLLSSDKTRSLFVLLSSAPDCSNALVSFSTFRDIFE